MRADLDRLNFSLTSKNLECEELSMKLSRMNEDILGH
jgi:hypothetical protein